MTTQQVNSFFGEFLKKLKREPMSVWLLVAFLGYQMYANHLQRQADEERYNESLTLQKQDIESRNRNTAVTKQLLAHFEEREDDRKTVEEKILDELRTVITNQTTILNQQKWSNISRGN